jgi:hypothetical protein
LTPIGGFVLSTLIFGGTISADAVISIGLIVGEFSSLCDGDALVLLLAANCIGQEKVHRHSPRLVGGTTAWSIPLAFLRCSPVRQPTISSLVL